MAGLLQNLKLRGEVITNGEEKFVIDEIDDDGGRVIVGELGNRWVEEPPEEGSECVDPDCDGNIGHYDADHELSCNEAFCRECDLRWAERNTYWEEYRSEYA